MADYVPITHELLTELSARLFSHADTITNAAARQVDEDLRLAARAVTELASLRFAIEEIAAETRDGNTAKELLKLIGDAS